MPSAKRSGLSATVGLALVVGLLLVAGTLAVSGGGILNSGGRLGVDPVATEAPGAAASGDAVDGDAVDPVGNETGETGDTNPIEDLTTQFAFTCDDNAIKDLSRRKWVMSQFTAGSRASSGYDQITWRMSRASDTKAKKGTTVTMEWMDPAEARSTYGAPARVQGSRALVITFNGPVDITANQTVDTLTLEPEGVAQIRNIQMFDGEDGKVHTVVGLRGNSCARLEAKGWGQKSRTKSSNLLLQIERFE